MERVRRIALALAAFAALAPPGVVAARPDVPPRVLVINSYHRGFTWSDQETDGIIRGFRERWPTFEPHVEYLDAKRPHGAGHEAAFLSLLRERYLGRPLDAVIATDDAALQLALSHRDVFAPGVPVAFCGVNDARRVEGAVRVAGLLEDVDVAGTLALALQLQPGLRRLVAVLDGTDTSQALGPRIRDDPAFAAAGVAVELSRQLSLDEVEALARGLGRGDALLLGSFVTDRLGSTWSYEEVARRVSAASAAPVYGLWEFQLGHGIVGGSLLSGELQGRGAAGAAIALVEGRPAGVTRESGHRRVVDVAAAVRFGLDASRAGADFARVNVPPSPWNDYRRELLAAAAAFAALLAFVAALLAVNRRLVLARRALRTESEERERLRLRLEETQRLEAVGRLAGGIAHDLNNLLTPILVCARMAREGLPPADPRAEDLDTILRSAERARELTRQVLAFSRRQRLDLRVLDLSEEVRRFHALLPRLIGEDVKVKVALAPGPLPVRADPGQLQQVLMNLAVNARDAMPGGGTLELATGTRPDGSVVLTVRDTGAGMPPEVKARAFEPFFTTKPVGQGTGLGLSTCHGIVKQHGGEIELESSPGSGTTFRIVLPRAGPSPEEAPPSPAAPRGGSGTILLVEDDPVVRQLAKRVLTGAGYEVAEAEDGPGAIALARRLDVDLLVTDVVMPGMGGRELRDRVLAVRPGLPVLFMSGYPALPGSGEALGWGPGDAILAKPFTADELLAGVEGVLGGPGRAPAA